MRRWLGSLAHSPGEACLCQLTYSETTIPRLCNAAGGLCVCGSCQWDRNSQWINPLEGMMEMGVTEVINAEREFLEGLGDSSRAVYEKQAGFARGYAWG